MTPLIPLTLSNPRWEAFALNLAAGATLEDAYTDAGFSAKNRKARAQALAENPDISARAAYLRSCLPRFHHLKQRFAPSHLLMPQDKESMMTWLWQVASGARDIPPIQLRAAALLIRLKGWHITRPANPLSEPPPDFLTRQEQHLLSAHNRLAVASDRAGRPVPEIESRRLYSALADAELTGLEADAAPPPGAEAQAIQPPPSPPQDIPHDSPPHPLEPQQTTAPDSPNGDKKPTSLAAVFDTPALPSPEPETTPGSQASQSMPLPLRDLDALLESLHHHLPIPGDLTSIPIPPNHEDQPLPGPSSFLSRLAAHKRRQEHLALLESLYPSSQPTPAHPTLSS